MSNAKATWIIELNCHCPECNRYVDLCNHAEFWHTYPSLEIAEHGTYRTSGMEVVCPKCGHEFKVDCEY